MGNGTGIVTCRWGHFPIFRRGHQYDSDGMLTNPQRSFCRIVGVFFYPWYENPNTSGPWENWRRRRIR
jgi:hypothetical protein